MTVTSTCSWEGEAVPPFLKNIAPRLTRGPSLPRHRLLIISVPISSIRDREIISMRQEEVPILLSTDTRFLKTPGQP